MTEFQLDTSGEIVLPYPNLHPHARGIRWPDLSPFAQGYVTAALRGYCYHGPIPLSPAQLEKPLGFRHLAPATLAAMLRDCERVQASTNPPPYPSTEHGGQVFWSERQRDMLNGDEPRFPLLTLTLNGAGLIEMVAS